MAWPERTGHGARRDRLREGVEAAPDHGRDVVDRARCHQHDHRRRRRDGEPAAAAADLRRHVPVAGARPGAATGRALRNAVDHRQRRVPAGRALLGSHHPPGPGRPVAAARGQHDARPRPTAARRSSALPQDIAGDAYDYPVRFFDEVVHEPRRTRPTRASWPARRRAGGRREAADHRRRRRALVGGRGRAARVRRTAQHPGRRDRRRPNLAATVAPAPRRARSASPAARAPTTSRPRPMSCWRSARGSRTSRPARGPCSRTSRSHRAINAARFDATKHRALSVVADARESARPNCRPRRRLPRRATTGRPRALRGRAVPRLHRQDRRARQRHRQRLPTYAQVVGVVDRNAGPDTYALTAAGGFPGELVNGWRSDVVHSFDAEYGFSCMGYEIAGAWGAKMAMPDREVVVFVGDGSLPDDEQRPVQLGAVGPQADRDRVRQRRVRRDQPPAGQPGWRAVQQPDRRREHRRGGARRLRRARRGDGVPRRDGATIAELEAAFQRARATIARP